MFVVASLLSVIIVSSYQIDSYESMIIPPPRHEDIDVSFAIHATVQSPS